MESKNVEETLAIIDKCLLEEETALAALKRWSDIHSVQKEEQEHLEYASRNSQTSPNFYL